MCNPIAFVTFSENPVFSRVWDRFLWSRFFCSQFKHTFYWYFLILLQIAHWGLVFMHLPESIGYITCKLERALKHSSLIAFKADLRCYITCKLERALKLPPLMAFTQQLDVI